jgi:plastocyanin
LGLLAGSSAFAGLAGCSSSSTEDSSSPDDQDESSSSTQSSSTDTSDDTDGESDSTDDGSDSDDTTTSDGTDGGAVVEMLTDNQGSYFDPKGLAVEPGTTVRFVNTSGSHGTTAYHPDNGEQPLRIPNEAEPWESPIYADSDQEFEVTLEAEGVYDYYCPPHESMGMVGRIVVGEPQDGPGTSSPEDLPPGARDSLPSVADVLENESVAGP